MTEPGIFLSFIGAIGASLLISAPIWALIMVLL